MLKLFLLFFIFSPFPNLSLIPLFFQPETPLALFRQSSFPSFFLNAALFAKKRDIDVGEACSQRRQPSPVRVRKAMDTKRQRDEGNG